MKVTVYTTEGKELEKMDAPKGLLDLKWNPDLVHQVVVSMETNARTPIAHTKDRSEVRGGGKKPWRQKGTGRARHGSRRSPIWVGGGVTFGPRNDKNFSRKVNKKMKNKALLTVLSRKMKDGELIFVDDIKLKEAKTKNAKKIIEGISTIKGFENFKARKRNKAVIAIDSNDLLTKKSFSNFSNIKMDEVRNLNPISLLRYKYVVIENPKKSFEILSKKIEK